jgi:hypothetical protein
MRRVYQQDPQRVKTRVSDYRIKYQDAYKARNSRYYQAQRDIISINRANRSEAERQKERDRVKRHNDRNPQQRLARVTARRALKMGALVGKKFTYRDIIARDGLKCYICGYDTIPNCADIKLRPTVEHLVPLIINGSHSLERAALAHFSCNCSKGRLKVEPGAVPTELQERCRRRISEYLEDQSYLNRR